MTKHFALFAALAASTWTLPGSQAQATELIVEDKSPDLGIGVYDRDDVRWRSKAIVHPDRAGESDRVWSGPDAFESEFGQPLDFSQDLIAQHGYSSGAKYLVSNGQLSVTTGAQGFTLGFGGVPGDKSRAAIFPAAAWGANRKDVVRLQMVLEQDAPETKWRLSTATPESFKLLKEFTISGAGRQNWQADVTFARSINDVWSQDTGLKIECVTPNVSLKLDLIKLAPSSANIYWRKSFELAQKPILAHASFNDFDNFDLFVNGRLAVSGNHLYPSATLRRLDLAPFLRAGRNTIAYRKQFYTWAGNENEPLIFEGVAVSRAGEITRILSDESWRASHSAPDGWQQPAFDDTSWKPARDAGAAGHAPHLTSLWDKAGTIVPNGVDPGHMGALDVAPANRRYPLFEDSETPAFRVRLPAGMQGKFKVSAELFKAGTSTWVERAAPTAFRMAGDWTQAIVPFKTRAPGPYRVQWTLRDLAGAILESRPEELIIIGPIEQQKVGLGSFESAFEKRLHRVLSIDCTQPAAISDEFLDHSGPYGTAQLGQGQVTTANGLTYRETGGGAFDYFSYRLHGLRRGEPYLVEVMVPDNKERATYASVMESRPVNYFNNGYFAGWHAATGAARSGGRYPLTMRLRPLRFLYFPSSAASAITIINTMNGVRAAASTINLYSIQGGMPALSMPASPRLIGPHDERITLNASTFGGENPLENAIPTALNGHRDAWSHWYRIYERKIRFLRFQGFNMSVEGLYQYYDTSFPKSRSSWTSDQSEIDLPLLAIKMYARNGIKVFLGVEYSFDPQLSLDSEGRALTISDRRMWAGEKTFQAVDRDGRQVGRGIWGNGNFLHPTTRKYFNNLIREIYDRYQSAGPVEGMYLGTFGWLLPGFQAGAAWSEGPLDIGYDDTTAALFEHETGIALGIEARDPQRFQKRYALLAGKYLARWKSWRAQKVRQSYAEISQAVRSGGGKWNKWKLLLEPTLQTEGQSPFRALDSSAQQRAAAFAQMSSDIDMPVGLYSNVPGIAVASPLPASAWQSHGPGDNVLSAAGLLSQRETGRAIEQIGGMALGGPLDEINIPSSAAPRWIWTQGTAGIFIPRPIEDNAMNDFVQVLRNGIPRTIIYSWLDVNAETAFGPQLRRFNKSFAVTPLNASFKDVPASQARGIVAQVAPRAGGLYVRLVNNSPYTLSGTMTTSASAVRDLVYDATLKPTEANGSRGYALQLAPNDIRILALNRADVSKLRFSFSFDAPTTAQVLAQTRALLGSANLSAAIPERKRAELQEAVARGDGFGTYSLLDSWEVLAVTSNAQLFATGPDNQKRLLEMLQREGVARIDVGASQEHRDGDGHLWLSDQAFLGTRFYGYARGNVGARGDIEIANTKAPRVYQTELWGDGLTYRVPLPNGSYKLSLHFAETFAPFSQPGSRIFGLSVQGGAPESIDLIARAGGQYRPFVLSQPVTVSDGLLEVKFSGNAELNGITIEAATPKGRR